MGDQIRMPECEALRLVVRMLAGYERGIYALLEVSSQVMECITPQNVGDIFAELPVEFTLHLKAAVESAPKTDDEWDAATFFHIGGELCARGYELPVKSAADQLAEEQQSKRRHRARVEAIREYLA